MANVALISCTSKKFNTKMKARYLYQSPLFIKSLMYTESKLKPEKIYILSAKYGLLTLEEEIMPYNETLNKKSKEERHEWAKAVFNKLNNECDVNNDTFIFLAGMNYYQNLKRHLKNTIVLMEKLPIGKRLQWLTRELNG
jgi:cytoplasmic iron level regulating protein YaaA (DUF328/UPF0246 family)